MCFVYVFKNLSFFYSLRSLTNGFAAFDQLNNLDRLLVLVGRPNGGSGNLGL